MAYGTLNVDQIQSSVSGVSLGAGNASIMKNRIINGAMVIDQRNAGASVTPTVSGSYTLDRWKVAFSQSSKFSAQQNGGSVTAPVGFTNYLGITSASAYSVTSSDYFLLVQPIEGFNTADLNWGTANAKTVTLSFWIYSSLTGTFGGAISNGSELYSYPFTYTVSSANTWTQISVTITGPTSGTWIGATNGIGLKVFFGLGVGSTYSGTAGSWSANNYYSATGAVSVVGTSGATFYITGVQLEVGSVATGFEYRHYQQELALCQRYFIKYGGNAAYEYVTQYGLTYVSGLNFANVSLPVPMRTSPSVSGSTLQWSWQGSGVAITSVAIDKSSPLTPGVQFNTGGGETQYRPGLVVTNNSTSGYLQFSAEL